MNYRKKNKVKVASFITLSIFLGFLLFIASPGLAWDWVTQDPELAKEWAEALGFKTKDIVGKVAPDIKPGMVIDSNNYKNYPGLKELLPKSVYDRFDPNSYAPLAPMKIKTTDQYHPSRGYLKKTLESARTVHIGKDGLTLEGYVGGLPFIHPKSGVELIHIADGHQYLGDTFCTRPMRMRLYGRNNRPERELRQECNGFRFKYCTDWREDLTPNPEGIDFVASGTFFYPKDISGTSYVRKRYVAVDKPDEFLLFVASMRRIRRMSGRDTQDALFGSDLIWDDYNYFFQKLSKNDFPCEYKLLPSREMLVPSVIDYNWPDDRSMAGFPDYRVDESGDQVYLHYGTWQRRWVHGVEVIEKDPAYCYSRRVLTIDLERTSVVHCDEYDQAGRLWRCGFPRGVNLSRNGEGMTTDMEEFVDCINKHRTILDMKGEKNPQWMGTEFADVRFLSRRGK
jgi:hypothetical protein